MQISRTKRFIAILPGLLGVMLLITYPSVSRISSLESAIFPRSPSTFSAAKIRTGITDTHKPITPKALSISMPITASDTGLTDIAQAVTLGEVKVQPLPKGEPGGRVIGRGKNIWGVFRFARVRHDLADWWIDQRSLITFAEWLNARTNIKTDMNVEGGAIRLTDPKLSKAPLVFFTGHDPALVRSMNLSYGSPVRSRLSEYEKQALRKYLIEDGGFVFFDDCGVNAPAEAFSKLVLAQLRYAMPECSVDRIPNNHEIYTNYYEMSGPPVGYSIFWWGTQPPKRNFLEGITLGDHLGVLVCRRDYMCATETMSIPGKVAYHSPGVLRFLTNTAIYALTHGGISDYSHYAPEHRMSDNIAIEAPIVVPDLE